MTLREALDLNLWVVIKDITKNIKDQMKRGMAGSAKLPCPLSAPPSQHFNVFTKPEALPIHSLSTFMVVPLSGYG
jgi:hypothetical protein